MTLRLLGEAQAADRVAWLTQVDGSSVRVRFRPASTVANAWRCSACGPAPTPRCPHAVIVAGALVRELFSALHDHQEEGQTG